MQGDFDREAWQNLEVEAALSEANVGDFVPEKEMAAKFNQLGQRKNAEADRWKRENHEAIQELNRMVEERGLFSDELLKVEKIMERVRKGEEKLFSLEDVERAWSGWRDLMPVILRINGYRFFFYSNEGDPLEPAHIHVSKAGNEAKIWLEPEAFLSRNDGFGARELREVIAIATEHRVFFAEKWHEYFA